MKRILLCFSGFCLLFLLEGCSKKESIYDSFSDDEENVTKCGTLDAECCQNRICHNGLVCDIKLNICKEKVGESDTDDDIPEQDFPDEDFFEEDSEREDSGGDDNDFVEDEPEDDDSGDDDHIQTPCEPNPCVWVANSTGICALEENDGYFCKCQTNYTWNPSTLKCEADTRSAECPPKPENTVWSDSEAGGLFSQTWSSSGWKPEISASTYSESAEICAFKCVSEDYKWNGSECINLCMPENPCTGFANSTGNCTTISPTEYLCECSSGYFWWGAETGCTKNLNLGRICTALDKCYNNLAQIECQNPGGDFFGQDVQYAASGSCTPQDFSIVETEIENEKIILDNNTNLEWLPKIPEETYNWEDAQNYCSTLVYGGYDDWRVPMPNELLTIFVNGKVTPALDRTIFTDMPERGKLWSTEYIKDENKAWYASINSAYSYFDSKEEKLNVLCVRGRKLSTAIFSVSSKNGDEVVTDSVTGLIWQKTYVEKNWQQALQYCESLTYAGYRDWRLPNKNELSSLVNYEIYNPASDFPDMPSKTFWTSSSSTVRSFAWRINFLSGMVHDDLFIYSENGGVGSFYEKTATNKVRCVRSEICGENKFWNGSECVADPCSSESCDKPHSLGNCQPRTDSVYSCDCESGYFWNGSACINPCDTNSCGSDPNSNGTCTVINSELYYCGCKNGYGWNNGKCMKNSENLNIGSICTGQTICYNNVESVACPALGEDFFGQDAQYSASGSCTPQNFTINGEIENEKTVIDNNTGLEWQQDKADGSYTWANAYLYCDNLEYAGHDDWRLPSPLEIMTILERSKYFSSINTLYFPKIRQSVEDSGALWTSKNYIADSQDAWSVSIIYGSIKHKSKSTPGYVLCVRGETLPNARFASSTVNDDTVISDLSTGLMWQKEFATGKTWYEALEYCANSAYANHSDWRLPNENELISLLNHNKSDSPYSEFDGLNGVFFSSSTYVTNDDYAALSVNFNSGNAENLYKTTNGSVICVRSDLCGENKFWNGFECLQDPCRPDSCSLPHAGICQPENESAYSCSCEYGYFWNGFACVSPCDPNPCAGDPNSDGVCTAFNSEVYYCGCNSVSSWNGGSCKEFSSAMTLGNICTGQTNCYNNSEVLPCSSAGEDFFGQDAQFAAFDKCTPQNFTIVDTGIENENIVLDNNTKLQWQQTPSEETMFWKNAYIYCDTLNYGGFDDWRLPNPLELLTIVDNSGDSMPVEPLYSKKFWTSKTYDTANEAYYFNAFYPSYRGSKFNNYKVLCVRGNEIPNATLSSSTGDNGDVTVSDSRTGLMWQKNYTTGLTWLDALKYCENSNYAEYSDWRLPNRNELTSLINYDRIEKPISDFPEMPIAESFWTSTSMHKSTSYAYIVIFGWGETTNYIKNKKLSAICVRNN